MTLREASLRLLIRKTFDIHSASGGGGPKLCEPEPLTSKVIIAAFWKREQLDLAKLARLRWVEKWRYERLAKHFRVNRSMVRDTIRWIKAIQRAAGLRSAPGTVRGT